MKHLKKCKGTTTKCNEPKGSEIPFLAWCSVLSDFSSCCTLSLPRSCISLVSCLHFSPLRQVRTGKVHLFLWISVKPLAGMSSWWGQQCSSTGISLQPPPHWVVPGTLLPLPAQIVSQWWEGWTLQSKRGFQCSWQFFSRVNLRQFSASGISRQCNWKHFKITFPHTQVLGKPWIWLVSIQFCHAWLLSAFLSHCASSVDHEDF